MNAVFEPTLIFVKETDWNNAQKQDDFLELLLCHIDSIDKYDICDIYWTEELQLNLVEQPNIHPWYQSDLRNPIIATIHQKFYSRLDLIPAHETICEVSPNFKDIIPFPDIHHNFLKLVHTLLDYKQNFYFCLGVENHLLNSNTYKFKGNYNNEFSPLHINNCFDWLNQLKVVELFYPTNIVEFETKIRNAIEIIRIRDFASKDILFDFEFSNQFKKDILKAINHRDKILTNITKKLLLTATEAGLDSQLRDEYLTQSSQYRFRVTNRPYSTRIQYSFANNCITFLHYYDEGEHDTGL